MAELWKIADIIDAVKGALYHPISDKPMQPIMGISIDTRTLAKGDLFIPLIGDNHDGHDHIKAAIDKGAACVLIDQRRAETIDLAHINAAIPLIKVQDCLEALQDLARHRRNQSAAKIIGITGSVGKTGATSALALALAKFGAVHATKGNLNNHIGMPLSLARMKLETEYGIFEMGMNHAGEIHFLSHLARPDIALITNIASAHSENFDHPQDIALAKLEIADGLSPKGHLIALRESPYYPLIFKKTQHQNCALTSFGKHPQADFYLDHIASNPDQLTANIHHKSNDYTLNIAAISDGLAITLSSVAPVLDALGLSVQTGLDALRAFEIPKGRGNKIISNRYDFPVTLIDESYNASPIAVKAALKHFDAVAHKGRKIVILGDFAELGGMAQDHYTSIAAALTGMILDQIWLVGKDIISNKNMQMLNDSYQGDSNQGTSNHSLDHRSKCLFFKDVNALLYDIKSLVKPHDFILVKGSNSAKLSHLIDEFTQAPKETS